MKTNESMSWALCRVLSDESRLKLLWCLMRDGEMSVTHLAERIGLGVPNASKHLRVLNFQQFIVAKHRSSFVFYSIGSDSSDEDAAVLLMGLKSCYSNAVSFSEIMWMATAFTHPRRIKIVQALTIGAGVPMGVLSVKTQISPPSLFRHVKKLEQRGFVRREEGKVFFCDDYFGFRKVLLKVVLFR